MIGVVSLALSPVSLAASVDPGALAELEQRTVETRSSAVVVLQNGAVVHEHLSTRKPRPIEAMSATKSVVSLAIGRLVTTGAISSVDVPVHTWFPEWSEGPRREITLRHLLDHTSGLQNVPDTTVEIYPSRDFVQLALDAELTTPPGSTFAYNNKAVNLLPAIVERVTGEKLDDWLRHDLFGALGIEQFRWTRDRAGNPHGMSGLQILPHDLARLGQLVLDGGVHDGQQLISADWLAASFTPSAKYLQHGLLWWLTPEYVHFTVDEARFEALLAAGVAPTFVDALRPAAGTFTSEKAYAAKLTEVLGEGWQARLGQELGPAGVSLSHKEVGPIESWAALGYLGQYLVVVPDSGIVGVRMIEASKDYDEQTDAFGDFVALIARLGDG